MMSEINLRQVILGVLTVVISLVLLVVAAVKLYPTQNADAPAADEAGQLLSLEMGVSSELDP
jgi:hypothetical protein